ncbi:histidinol-phosphate transaminase [Arsenicicoccus dermatophilus]|uniref:histidinol-phosphate transaminase n=1 Tax=Arsenicicoccus dermatophilus TaxID=1076331 RepID=UPI001F4CFBEF|nr:histidinol-phosphate transaminase [Arsenicicoccus dermatophilus]MCH8611601.1 histidinol-phosphate transaminase [Arsenicicoccus dermatophilus]
MTAADDANSTPATPLALTVRLREALGRVPAYVPGKPAPAVEGLQTYKVSSNENPYPPLPGVVEVIHEAAGQVNRYPDMAVTELTQALADFLGVPNDHIATGTGSSAVLSQLINATCDAGDEVVYAWRSFELYPIAVALAGAVSVQVPLTVDQRHDLDAMAAAITDRTRLVIVCSPNNPTGTVVHREELEAFLDKVPKDVLVVLDEAYLEFVRDPQAPDALEVYRAHDNVAVLRTFSKAYGLAGLRVGYAVAPSEIAAALRKTAIPFGVSTIAEDAAVASLGLFAELDERVAALVEERDRVTTGLAEQGWRLPETQANFVYFPLGEHCTAFADACRDAGLVVRQYGDDGVRVTIGEDEASTRLLEVTAGLRQRLQP